MSKAKANAALNVASIGNGREIEKIEPFSASHFITASNQKSTAKNKKPALRRVLTQYRAQ